MSNTFKNIPYIQYQGENSKNPLAFKHYNPDEVVEGKSMRAHLRFSLVYWHTFRSTGSDPFGAGTMQRPWDDGSNSVSNAQKRARVAFEFMEKLGVPYYAWHDRDVAPEGKNLSESNQNFDAVVKVLKEEQQRTGIKLLWGTANAFSHPRYVHGASTSCNADVFACAAAQVKKAIEVTHDLGGEGYTFWGVDAKRLGVSLNLNMKCWETLLPQVVRHPKLRVDLLPILKAYQQQYLGAMYSGCGGGYLIVVSERPVPGAFKINVRVAKNKI